MTLDPALLAAVVAAPDDDLIRLQAADWLDEHGDPERAEFIRVQCGIARLERCHPTSGMTTASANALSKWRREFAALCRRERELLPLAYSRVWGWLTPIDRNREVFRRGFACEITLPWADWIGHADALLAACPIRRVNRAKPRTCPYCSGEGCATHGHGDWTRKCDGSGKIPPTEPDWRGDGLVRLTTLPDVGYTFDEVRLWYDGKLVKTPAPHPSRTRYEIENVMAVLKAAEPAVRFVAANAGVSGQVREYAQGLSRRFGRGR